jgi:hypothetical protein
MFDLPIWELTGLQDPISLLQKQQLTSEAKPSYISEYKTCYTVSNKEYNHPS